MEYSLHDPIDGLPRLGPARREKLHDAGFATMLDLLLHFPKRYEVHQVPQPIATLATGSVAAIEGEVSSSRSSRRGRLRWTTIQLADGSGSIEVVFFYPQGLGRNLRRGDTIWVQGKVGERNGLPQVVASSCRRSILAASGDVERRNEETQVPVYDLPKGVPRRTFQSWIDLLLAAPLDELDDWREPSATRGRHLLPLRDAIRLAHRPTSDAELAAAHRRLGFEEFASIVYPFLRARREKEAMRRRRAGRFDWDGVKVMEEALPFALTNAQRRAVNEIGADLERSSPMHRLLHGEVGSGKSAVALLALAGSVSDGGLGAFLAPTEVLARQIHRTFEPWLRRLDLPVHLLVGSQRVAERRKTLQGLEQERPGVVIGTHSLLSESVKLPRLRLAVIDEQHRFGVSQRTRLREKGDDVDLLVMTATPIPRSLAMTLYGDLDLSVLDERPPGTGNVMTEVISMRRLATVIRRIRDEATGDGRVFVVCPLVTESERIDATAAEQLAVELQRRFKGDPEVVLAHGRLTAEENDAALEAFREGRARVLVATVLVEVGVDIPDATMMVVMDADRFGLAPLHQLRGRVGRSDRPGTCLLVRKSDAELAKRRLEVLERLTSGFEVAEEDLRLRGAGEVFGWRQHGWLDLRFADLVRDVDLLGEARTAVSRWIERGGVESPSLLGDRSGRCFDPPTG